MTNPITPKQILHAQRYATRDSAKLQQAIEALPMNHPLPYAIESAVAKSLESEVAIETPPEIPILDAIATFKLGNGVIFFEILNEIYILGRLQTAPFAPHLPDKYGFINIIKPMAVPCFITDTIADALHKAMAVKDLYLAPSLSTVLNYYDL